MTKPDDLRTNDEPQRILLEASERMKACYPDGARIEAILHGKRISGNVFYDGLGKFYVVDEHEFTHPFCPAIDPHKVLP